MNEDWRRLDPEMEVLDTQSNVGATSAPGGVKLSASRSRRPRRERKRYSGNSPAHYRIKELAAAFRAQLGEAAAANTIVAAEIVRASELIMLAELQRGAMIRGETVDLGDLLRLEGVARRAIVDLHLLERDGEQTLNRQTDYSQSAASVDDELQVEDERSMEQVARSYHELKSSCGSSEQHDSMSEQEAVDHYLRLIHGRPFQTRKSQSTGRKRDKWADKF
jgi:hypothetical protein